MFNAGWLVRATCMASPIDLEYDGHVLHHPPGAFNTWDVFSICFNLFRYVSICFACFTCLHCFFHHIHAKISDQICSQTTGRIASRFGLVCILASYEVV